MRDLWRVEVMTQLLGPSKWCGCRIDSFLSERWSIGIRGWEIANCCYGASCCGMIVFLFFSSFFCGTSDVGRGLQTFSSQY